MDDRPPGECLVLGGRSLAAKDAYLSHRELGLPTRSFSSGILAALSNYRLRRKSESSLPRQPLGGLSFSAVIGTGLDIHNGLLNEQQVQLFG